MALGAGQFFSDFLLLLEADCLRESYLIEALEVTLDTAADVFFDKAFETATSSLTEALDEAGFIGDFATELCEDFFWIVKIDLLMVALVLLSSVCLLALKA